MSPDPQFLLFIDEIHRFNKAQQDVLLPEVESGVIRLIGATTHNPFFYINSALVSRSMIFELKPLGVEDLVALQRRALADPERGKGYLYSHDFEGSYVPQAYLPEGRCYYEPTQNGMEKRIAERLEYWRARFEEEQTRGAS